MARSVLSLALVSAAALLASASNVCLDQPCAPANIISDIVFLVDSSNAFSKEQFEDIRAFLSSFSASLTIGSRQSQITFYTYGTSATSAGTFNQLNSAAKVKAAVAALQYEGEVDRNLEKALELEEAEVTAANGLRADQQKVLVVVAGDAWSGSNVFTGAALEAARKKFDAIYVIGIGMQATDNAFSEIRRLAGADANVFFAFDTRQLPYVGMWLAKVACPKTAASPTPGPTTTMPTPKPSIGCQLQGLNTDIFLIVDTSSAMTTSEFASLKQALNDYVAVFPIGQGETQFGLISAFSDVQTYYTGYNVPTYTRTQLLRTIQDLQQERGDGQALNLALQGLEHMYLKNSSPDTYKMLVYFSGNTNFDEDPTNTLLGLEKTYGVHTTAVQWTANAQQKALAALTGGLRCVIQAPNDDLRPNVPTLLEQTLCLKAFCR